MIKYACFTDPVYTTMAVTKRQMQVGRGGRNVRPFVPFQPERVYLPSHIWGMIVNVSELNGLGRMVCSDASIPSPCTTLVSSISTPAMAQWASERGLVPDQRFWTTSLKAGHISVLKWLYLKGVFLARDSCLLAAATGHLEILKWVVMIGCHVGESIVEGARNGHLEVVRWLLHHSKDDLRLSQSIAEVAAEGGHIHVLELLFSESWLWNPSFSKEDYFSAATIATAAARCAQVDVLQWLLDHGFESGLVNGSCQLAATTSHNIAVIDWMHEHTNNMPMWVCMEVATTGIPLRDCVRCFTGPWSTDRP